MTIHVGLQVEVQLMLWTNHKILFIFDVTKHIKNLSFIFRGAGGVLRVYLSACTSSQ